MDCQRVVRVVVVVLGLGLGSVLMVLEFGREGSVVVVVSMARVMREERVSWLVMVPSKSRSRRRCVILEVVEVVWILVLLGVEDGRGFFCMPWEREK